MSLSSNVLVSVTIILYNKQIFQVLNFPGAVTLSAIHSLVGFSILSLMSAAGVFEPGVINRGVLLRQCCIWGSSVAFDLLSLKHNSVGFFQIAKLSMLPLAAIMNLVIAGERPSVRLSLALLWLCGGIALTTSTDVQVNFQGSVFSVIAVCTTVLNQVMAGQVMHNSGMSSMQYTLALTLPAGIFLILVGPVVDWYATGIRIDLWLIQNNNTSVILGIMVTAVLGVAVNVTAYWSIKTTNAVTYQVAGQVKNMLIIVLAFILFSYPIYAKNVLGMLIAISGAVAYVYVKVLDQSSSDSVKLLSKELSNDDKFQSQCISP